MKRFQKSSHDPVLVCSHLMGFIFFQDFYSYKRSFFSLHNLCRIVTEKKTSSSYKVARKTITIHVRVHLKVIIVEPIRFSLIT